MSVQFGIFDHMDQREEALTQTFEQRFEFVRAAESAGFRGYHLAEHHGTPLGMAPSPGVYLAALARETSKIRLGPLVYLLPLYDPLRLIEEICMLDHLSDGRLEVGVGRGISPIELGFFKVDAEQSGSMYVEALEVIIKGLTQDRLTHHGTHYHYDDVPITSAPKQQPLPFWSASTSPDGQALAARHGMHCASLGPVAFAKECTERYQSLWQTHADDPLRVNGVTGEPLIGVYRQVIVAETDAAAEALARPTYKEWFDKLIKLWKEYNVPAPHLGPLEDYDVARDAGVLIVGSAQRVTDELGSQIDETGVNYVIAQLAFGHLDHVAEMRSLDLFATKVMPAL